MSANVTSVVIGAADQSVISELSRALAADTGHDVVGIADSTAELSALAARSKPHVVLLHDVLGPASAADVVRDIVSRAPATAVLVVNSVGDAASALAAMEAGAKGVLSWPLLASDVLSKVDAAAAWAVNMASLLSGATADVSRELGRHGRITAVAGAKGGVGATTVATHLAIDLQRRVPGVRVCLVDLDLQAGDVAGILEARQRVSIADVARVSEDLSAATVLDALVQHESGVSLLLTPIQVADTEFVTPTSVRAILSMLRREFDVILVDGGAHVTPAQAAAIEVADEVVVVVTPDVLAMRAYRRSVQGWEGLGVREEPALRVLINRSSRDDILHTEAIAKLTSATLLSTRLPAMFRRLERGVNARNPEEIHESVWWEALEAIGAEVGVVAFGSGAGAGAGAGPGTGPGTGADAGAAGASTDSGSGAAKGGSRRLRRPDRSQRGARGQRGQAAVETVALVPIVLIACLLAWQIALVALTFGWTGHAANVASRTYAIEGSITDARAAARDAVPGGLRDDVEVQAIDDTTLRVGIRMPVLCAACATIGQRISQTVQVVEEP